MSKLSVKTKYILMGVVFVGAYAGGFWLWSHPDKQAADELKSAEGIQRTLNNIAEEERNSPEGIQRAWDEAKNKCLKDGNSSFSARLVTKSNNARFYRFYDELCSTGAPPSSCQANGLLEIYEMPSRTVSRQILSSGTVIDMGTTSAAQFDDSQKGRAALIDKCEAIARPARNNQPTGVN